MDELLLNSQEQTPISFCNRNFDEAEYIEFPSQGYFYSNKNKKIKIRKLNWIDESLLATKSYYDNDTIIEEILKNVIVDSNFIIEEIIPIDIKAILIWLKLSAFGREHSFPFKCRNKTEDGECGNSLKVIWDLAEFDTPDYPDEYVEELKMFGHIQISINDNDYFLIVPSISKIKEVKKFLSSVKENYSNTEKLLSTIKFIKTNEDDIIEGVENIYEYLLKAKISIQDSRYLLREAESINLKIDTTQYVQCKNCNFSHTLSLSIDKNFFGLNSIKYKEYLIRSLNFLIFWGKIDCQSIRTMPTYIRKMMISLTSENLKTLYGTKK